MRSSVSGRICGGSIPFSLANRARKWLASSGNVAGALPERGKPDREDVEAVVQVGAEAAGLHLVVEVEVGGGDEAEVHRDLAGAADALDLLLLQHAQQPHLDGVADGRDLVQEEGASVRLLEEATLVGHGAGEAALGVAEQLRFQQRLRQCRAVDGDEGPAGAVRKVVHGAGDQLLAGARLAGDQHAGAHRRHALDQLEDARHRRRVADDAAADPLALARHLGDSRRSCLSRIARCRISSNSSVRNGLLM
jgi:hypothetical protein